jgi:hypothetical protein
MHNGSYNRLEKAAKRSAVAFPVRVNAVGSQNLAKMFISHRTSSSTYET